MTFLHVFWIRVSLVPPQTVLGLFFVQAAVIISIIRALSLTFRSLNQPQVIFEICGGILLGPSGIGRWDAFLNTIFPESSMMYLELVANIGLVLYIFLIGLEIDSSLLRKNFKTTACVAAFGLIVPFATGVLISVVLYYYVLMYDAEFAKVTFLSFSLFLGTTISVTAIGVMARILKEKRLFSSEAAVISLGAALIDETLAWILLILSVSLATATDNLSALIVFVRVTAFACVMYWIIAPSFKALVNYVESSDRVMSTVIRPTLWAHEHLFAFTVLLILLTSWITEFLGVHAIFGAFMVGLLVPAESRLAHNCRARIESFVTTFMLPLYFAISGLQTDITQIDSLHMVLMVFFVLVMSTLGKYLGCGIPAWLCGLSFRNTAMIAVLMNTRGIFELIVLNVGVKAGIISTRVFTIMVLMTLITTFMASPMIDYLYPTGERKNSLALGVVEEDEVEMPHMNRNRGKILSPHVTTDWAMRDIKINLLCDDANDVEYALPLLYLMMPTIYPSRVGFTVLHLSKSISPATAVAVPVGSSPLPDSVVHDVRPNDKGSEEKYIQEVCDRVSSFCSLFDAQIRFIDESYDIPRTSQQSRVPINVSNITIVFDNPSNDSLLTSFSQTIVTSPTPVALLRQKEDLAAGSNRAVHSILVVISGCPTDVHVIGFCQYIAFHHRNVTVNICVMLETPNDSEHGSSHSAMNSTVWEMLRNLKKLVEDQSIPNITIGNLHFTSLLTVYSKLKELDIDYDVAICSFVKSFTAGSRSFHWLNSSSSSHSVQPPWIHDNTIEQLESGSINGEDRCTRNVYTLGLVGSALERLMAEDSGNKHGKAIMTMFSPYFSE